MHDQGLINLHNFTEIFPLKFALAMRKTGQKLIMKPTDTFRNGFAKSSKLILWLIMMSWCLGLILTSIKHFFLIIHLSLIALLTENCYGQLSDWVQLGQREFDTKQETETFFYHKLQNNSVAYSTCP